MEKAVFRGWWCKICMQFIHTKKVLFKNKISYNSCNCKTMHNKLKKYQGQNWLPVYSDSVHNKKVNKKHKCENCDIPCNRALPFKDKICFK